MIDTADQAGQVPRRSKAFDSFDFKAMPSLNKMLVRELARCEYVERRENVIALGNSGTGKTHIALGLGLAACQKGLTVGFITAAALVHELMEARDEKRLLRFQKPVGQGRRSCSLSTSSGSCRSQRLAPNSCSRCSCHDATNAGSHPGDIQPASSTSGPSGIRFRTPSLGRCWTASHPTMSTSWNMNGDSYRLNQSRGKRKTPPSTDDRYRTLWARLTRWAHRHLPRCFASP